MGNKEEKLTTLLSVYSKVLEDIITYQKSADDNLLQWIGIAIVPILSILNMNRWLVTVAAIAVPCVQLLSIERGTQYHTFVAMLRGYAAYLEEQINALVGEDICLYNSQYVDKYIASIKVVENKGVRKSWFAMCLSHITITLSCLGFIIIYHLTEPWWFYALIGILFIAYLLLILKFCYDFSQKERKRFDAREFPKQLRKARQENTSPTGYPSIDKPWQKHYSEEAINAPLPECSIYDSIYQNNKRYPHDVALLYFGRKITYKKLFSEIERTAKALVTADVKPGDNVAVCMPAVPEAVYAILALNRLGANANMLNPTFTAEQLTERVNETGAKLLLVVNELYSIMKEVLPNTCIQKTVACPGCNSLGALVKTIKRVKKIDGTTDWNRFIADGSTTNLPAPIEYRKNYPAIMVYSSGTTGASKGIQLTNDGINATITEYSAAGFQISRQDRYFMQIPIWFSTGVSVTLLVPLFYGVTAILEPVYDFALFNKDIAKYRPNFMITATGLLEYLIAHKYTDKAYASFKCLAAGGEYVTPYMERKVSKWLADNRNKDKLHKGYGMCELGGTVTYTTANCNVIGSAGIPTPHVTVAAFDKATHKELKYGERGEIRVLSPCRMLGYYKNPEATEAFFHTDEKGQVWACTGDMGSVAEDGNVYVDGRISDSYDKEGNTVYLFDIERAILSVDTVRQCKVVVSEVNGEVTHVAHIVLTHAVSMEDVLGQIADVCHQKLDKNHQPALVKIHTDALPVSSSGKLDVAMMKKDKAGLLSVERVNK